MVSMEKKPLIILTGPTAVGKTKLSIALAKEVGGEIISADSMQVYRYMDIGSAKIKQSQMQGVRHYMIDELDPGEDFNVVLFARKAKEYMNEIYSNGHVPILTGGTGFYIQAVLYDIDFTDNDKDTSYRRKLEEEALSKGAAYLHNQLKEVDKKSAEDIHENNIKRVIRALEFYHLTGIKISEHNEKESRRESPYAAFYFVLNDERETVYENIDKRVDIMIGEGLVDEVRKLKEMGFTKNNVSMQGLGYKEILAYLNNEIALDEAVYTIKRDTRHFAKRQITWFKREKDVIWMNKKDYNYDDNALLQAMLRRIRNEQQSAGQ